MFKKIMKPVAYEMLSVIHFLNERNMKPADIHRQLCEVCGEHATSDSMLRRWVRYLNEGRESVHNYPQSGRPSVVNEDLVRAVEEKIQENRRLAISSLSLHFSQILRSLLHEIASDKLRFRKLCSLWVPKMRTEEHK
jgi:transposase-like protein